jgi:hypothetical protein
MSPPRRLRASVAIDQAIADAEIDRTSPDVISRLTLKREDARAACGEFFALAKARGIQRPPCPGCEARELESGGHA